MNLPNNQDSEKLGDCRICFQEADGLHFSVISCRACAAFFRRTTIMNLTYICKNSEECQVEKSHRNMCRSCRFKRCQKEGMKTDAVQLKRDSINNKRARTLEDKTDASLNDDFRNQNKMSKTEVEKQTPILKQMSDGYDHFMKIRRATSTLLQNNQRPKVFDDNPLNMQPSRFDSAKQVCQVETHLITDIVNTYFSPFDTLSYEDKVAFFKNFFCYFSHTDRAYQSYKKFEQECCNNKILMPDGGFIKRDELGKFYENSNGVHTTPDEAAKIFQPALDYILDVIIDYMRRIKITEIEYLATLGFCLWDDAVPGLSATGRNLANETQTKLLNELQNCYMSQQIPNNEIFNRVGRLMLLVPKLTKCVIMLRENSVVAELFNLYEADVCCKNFKDESSVKVECTSTCIVHTKQHQ